MKICFENKSSDLWAVITFQDKTVLKLAPNSTRDFELNGNALTFSVKYLRDFAAYYNQNRIPKVDGDLRDAVAEKITNKAINSVGNLILQVVNTYEISALSEGSVIILNDRVHYHSVKGVKALFGCFPVFYYFGQAECEGARVEVVSSVAFNRASFISFYRFIYKTLNLHGIFFNFIKYKVQIDNQREVSKIDYITNLFKSLYALPFSERDYQLKPATVLTDKFLNFLKGKLPNRIYKKFVRKFKRYF